MVIGLGCASALSKDRAKLDRGMRFAVDRDMTHREFVFSLADAIRSMHRIVSDDCLVFAAEVVLETAQQSGIRVTEEKFFEACGVTDPLAHWNPDGEDEQ